ncbi:MAG: tyrosine-type recombinase/integrase [Anaerolineae bacterium]
MRKEMVAVYSRQDPSVEDAVQAFMLDRQARRLSRGTVGFYGDKLSPFARYLAEQGIFTMRDISAPVIRQYMLHLQRKHNAGGAHAAFRAIRALLRWWELEEEPTDWKNPLRKLRAPKVPVEILEPVAVETFDAMLKTCERGAFLGKRDYAVMQALLDTGARASEFLALNREDVDEVTGQVTIRSGKGGKPRVVFLGSQSLRALAKYLRSRTDGPSGPLWISRRGSRLTYTGLRDILRRRARRARAPAPSLHSFRRAFALSCLRNGVDVYSLQRLLGHADLSVVRRYLAQTTDDLREAHQRGGPVDNLHRKG